MPVTQLNHAVLYVSDVARSAQFYAQALGFREVDRFGPDAVFMRAAASDNHHDLALMRASAPHSGGRGAVGLYHLAWEVDSIEELAALAGTLSNLRALTGMSDHGVSKSLYGVDPDSIEFELMWRVPREAWGEYAERAVVMPLDLQREIERFGSRSGAR